MDSLDDYLSENRISDDGETFNDVIDRVISSINIAELKYNSTHDEINDFSIRLKNRMKTNDFIPSTPILTNAGRHISKPLTACSVPDISLTGDLSKIKNIVEGFHRAGMGTGFNFNECENPIEVLKYLNEIAIDGQNGDKEERPVGNMGILSIYHPKIIEFINIKRNLSSGISDWKFNLSIDMDENFLKF